MISYELAAKAIKEPGFRIRKKGWYESYYVYIEKICTSDPSIFYLVWKDEKGNNCNPNFLIDNGNNWEPYVEKPKMVKWYRPRVIWFSDQPRPIHWKPLQFHTSQDLDNFFFKCDQDVKVLEWEEKEFPATYEECE